MNYAKWKELHPDGTEEEFILYVFAGCIVKITVVDPREIPNSSGFRCSLKKK